MNIQLLNNCFSKNSWQKRIQVHSVLICNTCNSMLFRKYIYLPFNLTLHWFLNKWWIDNAQIVSNVWSNETNRYRYICNFQHKILRENRWNFGCIMKSFALNISGGYDHRHHIKKLECMKLLKQRRQRESNWIISFLKGN